MPAVELRIDSWLLLAVIGILGASLVTLHAIGPVAGGNPLLRQTTWGVVGLVILLALSRVRLDVYDRLAPFVYGLSIVALVAVLFIGEVRAGTRGWFAVGPLTLQPSEFARLGTMLMVAAWFGRRTRSQISLSEGLMLGLFVAVPSILVMVEPDLGVALTPS